MSYRPRDWKNPHNTDDSKVCCFMPQEAYEAGGDAMLEGLKKEGQHKLPGQILAISWGHKAETADKQDQEGTIYTNISGTVVFFPDDEVKV